MLPHAPGVQMANIPEDGVTLKEESEAGDEANPDKRMPQQIKDKIIEPDNEFEDSTKSGNRNENDSNINNTTGSKKLFCCHKRLCFKFNSQLYWENTTNSLHLVEYLFQHPLMTPLRKPKEYWMVHQVMLTPKNLPPPKLLKERKGYLERMTKKNQWKSTITRRKMIKLKVYQKPLKPQAREILLIPNQVPKNPRR